MTGTYDAVVVGSGPNGLTAAVTLAQQGLSVLVVEAQQQYGGGLRSDEDTLPGFVHDRGATVHALTLLSPALRAMHLERHGLRLAHPELPVAHPLPAGRAAVVHRDVATTARGLGTDAAAYRRVYSWLTRRAGPLMDDILAPARVPRHPVTLAGFGLQGALPASAMARRWRTPEGQALFAGLATHSMLRLEEPFTAAVGLVLGVSAHAVGWPVAVGGSQAVADALVACLRSYGGTIEVGCPVTSLSDLPPTRAVLLDTPPSTVLRLAGDDLPDGYARRLRRFRYGAGICKVDWALDGPVPWTSADVARAGTVHLGGTAREIAAAEREVIAGGHPQRPYVLVVQPSVADPSRAPHGKHTLWAYTHVPAGSTVDMTARIEAQIERAAPGFRDRVLARRTWLPADLERANPSLLQGVISGGSSDWTQIFTRPVGPGRVLDPYAVPTRPGQPALFLCSASTPPGGGAHGMSGYWAARSALRRFGLTGIRSSGRNAASATR